MRTRTWTWTRLATAAALSVAPVGLATFALAQSGGPKYYPGTITPYQPPSAASARGASPPALTPPSAAPAVRPTDAAPPPKPKLFAPANENVRPIAASGNDLPKIGSVEPASLPLPPTTTGPEFPSGSPNVVPERSAPLPNVVPLDRLKPPAMPEPVRAPAATSTAAAPAAPAAVTFPTSVGAKHSPNVTVEYDMPESIGVGQPLSYHLVVRNTGTSAVSGVRIDQEMPAGATFVSSEPPAETTSDGRMGWTVGNLEAAAEKRIKVTVKPTDEGELRGRATVSFVSAVEGRVKVTRPRVGVSIAASEVVRVGEKVAFTIKLTNTGTGPANTVTLHAKLSDGLSHPAGQVIEAPLSNLPAGQTKTITLEAVAAKPGAQQCVLSVFADGNPAEQAKASVTLVEPLLTAKQTGPARCLVKSEPTYQIELANPGSANTDPLTVWTVVPEGFEFVQASDGGTFSATNKAVMWKLSALNAAANKTISLKLRATAPTEGVIRTIAQSGTTEQPNTGVTQAAARGKVLEAKSETVVKAEGVPALRFEVVDLEDPVEVGKEATYEIKVTNQGTGACTNVSIVAELGEGTTFVGVVGPTNGRASGNAVVFDALPQLPVKSDATYKVRVKGAQAGDSRFRVKLTCDQIKTPVTKEENTRFYKE